MEKWLMVLNLNGEDEYLMVRKDMHQEVQKKIGRIIDEYEEICPPYKMIDYIMDELECDYNTDIVERVKIGSKLIRVVII